MVIVEGPRGLFIAGRASIVDETKEVAWAGAKEHIRIRPDFGWVMANYVDSSPEGNTNGHIFRLEELRSRHATVVGTPLNMGHASKFIVGSTVADELLYPIGETTEDAELAWPFTEILANFYRGVFPEEWRKVQAAHDTGSSFVSMECIPESLTCAVDGETFPYDGPQSDTYTCGHLNNVGARKFLDKPFFVGTGLILPPQRPGWRNANVTELGALIEANIDEANRIYDQVAEEVSHLSDTEWTALMADLLAGAFGPVPDGYHPKKKKRKDRDDDKDEPAQKAGEIPKVDVNFRKADGDRSCGSCVYADFSGAGGSGVCDLVEGSILPDDVCDLWEPGGGNSLPFDPGGTSAAANGTGGMIALIPDDPGALSLAVEGADPASDLHVTIAYVTKDVAALDDATRAAIHDAAVWAATRVGPFTATVSGFGALGPEDPPATVLFLEAPELVDAYELVWAELDNYGSESFPERYPSFVPHLTLGYGVDMAAVSGFHGESITFSTLAVVLGGERSDYPLGVAEAAKLQDPIQPKPDKVRFDGVTIRRDKNGYYVHTHRARSKSYPSIEDIPDKDIRFIESTG